MLSGRYVIIDNILTNEGIPMKKLSTVPISSLSSCPHGTRTRITGAIQELSVFQTKSNDDMAIARIADTTGAIEVFIFPNLYKQVSHLLTKGTIITLQGRTYWDPGSENKIVAEDHIEENPKS
jgi:DNA polymerase III alpha subunit